MPDAARLAPLPADVRGRLEHFLGRVERLRIEDLPMFAARPLDEQAYARAADQARAVSVERRRESVLKAIQGDVGDWLGRLYSAQQFYPEWTGTAWGKSSGSAEDRVRLRRSLFDAISAIVLWDALDDADRDELVGPWAALVE